MTGNPNVEVRQLGHSIWYDNLSRDMIHSGELQDLVDNYGVIGMTSNPAIFEKAIGEGKFYDESIADYLNLDANEIFDKLAIDDIQHACDILRPVFDQTNRIDGYVSLEVSPNFANDTESTLREAKRLFKAVARPNVMIKIPGTPAGLPAIEEALYAGVNINITLLFAVKNYIDVAERYIAALERRLDEGLPVDHIASVASFFLSRIDTAVDQQLENNIRSAQGRDLDRVTANSQLIGKMAIANARITYKRFKEIFYGERFARLRAAGAQVQRPLWASTSTKNPNFSDTYYADALIGKDTVDTMPKVTLLAFRDHGTVAQTLDAGDEQAQETLDKLAAVGIDLELITRRLQEDGVDLFNDAFKKLIARVEGKRKMLMTGFMERQTVILGEYQKAVDAEIKRLREQKSITRFWARDTELWKPDQETAKSISNRLGWLTVAGDGRIDRMQLHNLQSESQKLGWRHVVLLGMGGSSLAAEVLAKMFGPQPDFPSLLVLDSTDPQAVLSVEHTIDLAKTVFIVASKSGATLETLSMQRYFCAKYAHNPGEHFIAITDPGSELEHCAKELNFRAIFLNPEDIGGRYSALSYFGMVPAALLGLDFNKIMDAGLEMQYACGNNVMGINHPGIWLGAIMGVLAQKGCDKLTILASREIASFGDWAEQLVAESTGKEDRGIVPVIAKTMGHPHDYSDDRLFIYLRLDHSDSNPDDEVRALQEAGHPVVTFSLRSLFDLGAEFFRWEYGTAVAGMVLKINPFDEPDVAESKRNTNDKLDFFARHGHLPEETPVLTEDGVSLYAPEELGKLLHDLATQRGYHTSTLSAMLAAYFTFAHSGDYLALLAYLPQVAAVRDGLEQITRKLRHTFKRPVTMGFGPRYLHSTGQLHKGGPNSGVFLLMTMTDSLDPAIPEAHYGFSTLKQAQVAGDLDALQAHGRRVMRLHISDSLEHGFHKIQVAIAAAEEKLK